MATYRLTDFFMTPQYCFLFSLQQSNMVTSPEVLIAHAKRIQKCLENNLLAPLKQSSF